jgi:DNA-binding MarR family transcriptional regulator
MTQNSQGIADSALIAARELRVVFSRMRRRLREVASSGDLSASQTAVLMRLFKEGASTASVLAAGERVRPQSMASTLAALTDAGLIKRSPDPEDGRRQVVTLTAAGRKRVEGDRLAREEWLARAMQAQFTEAQRRKIVEALALLDKLTGP